MYAPNDTTSRSTFLDSLLSLRNMFNRPWCIGGDFNEIRSIGERRGYSRSDRGRRDFNGFVDRIKLFDPPMLGRRFTWCNRDKGKKWSRIDRLLLVPSWMEILDLKVWGLPRDLRPLSNNS